MSMMRTSSFRHRVSGAMRALMVLLAVGFIAGCGGDGPIDPVETPSFTISLSGSTLTITQGENGTVTVSIARLGGFTGAVSVVVEGLPQGVTAGTLNIASGTTSGVLQLTAAAGATVGGAQLTVRGTGTGVDPETASLALTVNVSTPAPGGNTSWEFCAVSGLPGWVAVKNGNGAWTRVTGASGVYSFQIDNTGGIAWVWEGATGAQNLHVIYGTQAELSTAGGERCINPGAGKTVNGSVPGMTAGGAGFDAVVITLGGAFPDNPPSAASPSVTFRNVPTGSVDLLAGRSFLNFGAGTVTPMRYFILRGLDPADGSTLPPTDLFGGDSFAPSEQPLTILGATGLQILTLVSLRTAGGSFGNLSTSIGNPNWYAVPGARLQAGDVQLLSVTSSNPVALSPTQTTFKMIGNPGAQTVNMVPALTAPTVIPLTATGYARARVEYAIQTQYNRYWKVNFRQEAPAPLRAATVEMSQGFRGSATGTATLEIPDFTGVNGWNADWGLKTGNQVTWRVTGIGGWEGTGVSAPTWTDGNTYGEATHMGTFTP